MTCHDIYATIRSKSPTTEKIPQRTYLKIMFDSVYQSRMLPHNHN